MIKQKHVHSLHRWGLQNELDWGPPWLWYRLVPSQWDCKHPFPVKGQRAIPSHF